MELYTPLLAIIMYLTSLVAPEVPAEVTLYADEESMPLLRNEEGLWSVPREEAFIVGVKNGYFFEQTGLTDPMVIEEKMTDHLELPVDLEAGRVQLKRSALEIGFEREEKSIVFTISRRGEEATEVLISWTD